MNFYHHPPLFPMSLSLSPDLSVSLHTSTSPAPHLTQTPHPHTTWPANVFSSPLIFTSLSFLHSFISLPFSVLSPQSLYPSNSRLCVLHSPTWHSTQGPQGVCLCSTLCVCATLQPLHMGLSVFARAHFCPCRL